MYTYRRKTNKTAARVKVEMERICDEVGIISSLSPPALVERTAIVCRFLVHSDSEGVDA